MTDPPIRCPKCDQALTQVGQFWICPDHGQVSPQKPFAPLRMFLSYGHDSNEELVRRIKADLEKRGHDVWIDKSKIKFGDDWRRKITDGILDSSRVLSFLSKYSTRDPGVCLDEIAIAIGVKGGNIQTILVETEQEVKPPPSISHIQWLDMHDWKEQRAAGEAAWEQWYQVKLAEIVAVVESDESRRFAGEIRTLEEHLKPISSDSRIFQLLRKGLVGRAWLVEAIEQWRNAADRASRLFWILGAPGVGKSSFAAHLAHYGRDKVIAVQFCEYDKPDHRNAHRIVRTLAFQIATRLPDYRKLLLALPEITELDRKNPAELFDYLLADPLRHTIEGGRERYLIVIDALDEAGGSGRNELVEMLARNAPRLPDWIGIVATSRPESDVIAPLQGLNPFVLDTATESNRADIREYLRRELASPLQDRADADRLVEQVLEKSEGVFLYVERFCDDVQRGHFSLDRPDQFPQGLGGIFFQYFQRQFPDLEKFRKDVRPALRAILAAREPLPMEILQRLFNWQDEELRDFTRPLGSLFPTTTEAGHEVIKPYHKSLADWLADEGKAGAFFVSILEGCRLLVDLGWRQQEQGAATMSGYFLAHLPAHLATLERWEALVSLLCCEDYVKSVEIRLPTRRYSLVLDYQEALRGSPFSLRNRLWDAAPVCSLLALKAIGSLVDRGELGEARVLLQTCADAISSRRLPELTSTWSCLAGRLAIYAGDRQEADSRLAQALTAARDAAYQEGVAKALLGIGVAIRKFGGSHCDAQDALHEALKADFSSFDMDLQARVLLNLAMVHICKGQAREADDCLSNAGSLIERNDNPVLHAWLHKYQGFLRLLRQDCDGAAEQFRSAGETFSRQGHFQEQLRCDELVYCALGPVARLYAQERIERASAARLPRERGLELQKEIRRAVDAVPSLDTVPSESDARRMAAATEHLILIIRDLERRLDPEPLSGLTARRAKR
ncbi:MAG TPA: toll/interleukin-1 receptor domain-containing protein [Planctomycetota bacterium]|nr:toll/interleukin-1 receptor domain-containing protein [Planctomycetota bacterium]